MAYRISATTDRDQKLLNELRHMAWQQRIDVSQIMREAFLSKIYGGQKHWPAGYKSVSGPNRGDEILP